MEGATLFPCNIHPGFSTLPGMKHHTSNPLVCVERREEGIAYKLSTFTQVREININLLPPVQPPWRENQQPSYVPWLSELNLQFLMYKTVLQPTELPGQVYVSFAYSCYGISFSVILLSVYLYIRLFFCQWHIIGLWFKKMCCFCSSSASV